MRAPLTFPVQARTVGSLLLVEDGICFDHVDDDDGGLVCMSRVRLILSCRVVSFLFFEHGIASDRRTDGRNALRYSSVSRPNMPTVHFPASEHLQPHPSPGQTMVGDGRRGSNWKRAHYGGPTASFPQCLWAIHAPLVSLATAQDLGLASEWGQGRFMCATVRKGKSYLRSHRARTLR
jgi:hypothetical protein